MSVYQCLCVCLCACSCVYECVCAPVCVCVCVCGVGGAWCVGLWLGCCVLCGVVWVVCVRVCMCVCWDPLSTSLLYLTKNGGICLSLTSMARISCELQYSSLSLSH